MSDKYITYGKGCDIDPEEVDEEIARGTYYGDSYALGKLANKLIDALQQREEMRLKALELLLDVVAINERQQVDLDEAIGILKATDGDYGNTVRGPD